MYLGLLRGFYIYNPFLMRRCIKQQLSIQRVTMIFFFIPLCLDLLANMLVLVLLPENRFVKHKFWQQRDVNLVRCLSVRCKIIITIMKEQINNIFCLNPDNCLKRYLVYIYTWRLFCLLFPFLTFSLNLIFQMFVLLGIV